MRIGLDGTPHLEQSVPVKVLQAGILQMLAEVREDRKVTMCTP